MKLKSVDRRSLPVEVTPGATPRAAFDAIGDQGRLDFKVVLIACEPSTVVAYRGSGSDDWVMRHGDKLSFAEAEPHFPSLAATLEACGLTYDE